MKQIQFNSLLKLFSSKFCLEWRLILIGVYFPLIIFAFLALGVTRYPQWLWWDTPILLLIHQTSNSFLNQLAVLTTNLGYYPTTIPLIIIITLVLTFLIPNSHLPKWRSLFFVIINFSISIGLHHNLKIAFHRPRPHLWESFYPLPHTYSFPSGHALSSMTFTIILIILTWQTRWRWLTITLGSIFAILIAWTRLYLDVHYPSDILASWQLAIATGIALNLIFKAQGEIKCKM